MEWSFSAELLSIILVIMMGMFCYDKKRRKNIRTRLFLGCLLLTGFSSAVNILAVLSICHFDLVSYSLCSFLNNLYFLIIIWSCTLIAVYLFEILLKHVYDKSCRTRAYTGLFILNLLNLALVLTNPWTRAIFWIGKDGSYHRGPFVNAGYFILLLQLVMLMMCYVHNRKSVERKVTRVIYMLPPIVILLTLFQLAYRELLINGLNMSFALLIVFINFQHFQIGRDSLTGVENRKSFYEELTLRLDSGQDLQIIMVALKDFASINQRYGYETGDELLYSVALWLESASRTGRVFRFANTSFALLCSYKDEHEAQRILDLTKERFENSWHVGSVDTMLPAHIGSMNCQSEKQEPTYVIEALALMMNYAKQKDLPVVSYDKEILMMYNRRKYLKQLLLDSIEEDRFQVWYQPIFNCRTKQFESAEALVRLPDYEGNLISPAVFIPFAEESGLIEAIARFVWRDVCSFLRKHQELPLRYISINMSMQQFMDPRLHDQVVGYVTKNGLRPDQIKMEITEREVSADMKYMSSQMEKFAREGFKFCADDFGTGYCNFDNALHLPFEYIKMDRSLIMKLTHDQEEQVVVTTLIQMFHTLGKKIIAEGIETTKQQELLCQMGVDYIQGFYYARPMPEDEFLEFLCENRESNQNIQDK